MTRSANVTPNPDILTNNPGAGFEDPVFQSQAAFRSILNALSEPGTVHVLDGGVAAPQGFHPASATILLTLVDYETPLWLPEERRSGAAGTWVRFHAATPLAETPVAASFAVFSGMDIAPRLEAFSPGNDLFPDRAATLIVECQALEGGEAVELSGPGIPGTRRIAPQGLRPGFWDEVAANNALYPLGVDMLLVSGSEIIGLPRSTQIALIGGQG